MRQLARHIKMGRWSRAALACLAILLLWPASAAAEIGRCLEVSDLAERGIDSFMRSTTSERDSDAFDADSFDTGEVYTGEFETSEADESPKETPASVESDTPCGDNPDADPSANFCFEDAEGQISTLPTLLARWRGEKAADALVDSLTDTLDAYDGDEELLAETTVIPEPQPDDGDSASCSDRPDMCRSLPPLPPTLVVDASTSAARQDELQRSIPPTQLATDEERAWARLKVRPTLGHRTPPDQPPRA